MSRKTTETVSLPWGGNAPQRSVRFADKFDGPTRDLLADLIGQDNDPSAPWELSVSWDIEGGNAVPTCVSLRSVRGEPVTAQAWRSVRVSDAIAETRLRLKAWARMHPNRGADAGAALAKVPGGKRVARDDDRLARVAEVYTAALAAGRRDAVRAVGEAFRLSADDVRPKGWVRTARGKGLIPGKREEG